MIWSPNSGIPVRASPSSLLVCLTSDYIAPDLFSHSCCWPNPGYTFVWSGAAHCLWPPLQRSNVFAPGSGKQSCTIFTAPMHNAVSVFASKTISPTLSRNLSLLLLWRRCDGAAKLSITTVTQMPLVWDSWAEWSQDLLQLWRLECFPCLYMKAQLYRNTKDVTNRAFRYAPPMPLLVRLVNLWIYGTSLLLSPIPLANESYTRGTEEGTHEGVQCFDIETQWIVSPRGSSDTGH